MLNHISLMGRLTRTPELKVTPAGKSVCTIILAVERDCADSNGVREADFIDVVCWGKTAEFVSRYYRKGLLVAVTGRMQTRRWQDKHGQNRVTMEVIAEQCYFAERQEKSSADDSLVRGGRESEREQSFGRTERNPTRPRRKPVTEEEEEHGSGLTGERGKKSDANQRSVRGGRGGEIEAEQPFGLCPKGRGVEFSTTCGRDSGCAGLYWGPIPGDGGV